MLAPKNCEICEGDCCKYVAMEIDCPEDREDFENIRWYVAHKNIKVFVEEDNSWNIEFATPCKYLTGDNKCSIHKESNSDSEIKRPTICKEFGIDQCVSHNDYAEKYEFKDIADVDKYIKEVFEEGKHIICA